MRPSASRGARDPAGTELLDVELSSAGGFSRTSGKAIAIRVPCPLIHLDDMSRSTGEHTFSRMGFIDSNVCLAGSVAFAARRVHQSSLGPHLGSAARTVLLQKRRIAGVRECIDASRR
jgi:hypothetical protein